MLHPSRSFGSRPHGRTFTTAAPPPDDPTARLIQKVYVGLKRRFSKNTQWPQEPTPTQWQCFLRAAKRLRQAKHRGYPVSPAHFVWAVFQRYGVRTYPQHFVSEVAWTLYCEWNERREHLVSAKVSFAEEYDTLSHLAATRGQKIDKVWGAVGRSGIFTKAFVTRMDRELRRAA